VLERFKQLESIVPLQGMLGYLNFAGGKPDARFEKQLSDVYGYLAEHEAELPWEVLKEILKEKLFLLKKSGTAGFQNIEQAEAVLDLAFTQVLHAYRQHHHDLLFHLHDRELIQPFFLARAIEAVLLQGGPWSEQERIISGAMAHLNDYVGHRPIAILENRPKGEPYNRERVRPIPLFIKGAGVAWGRYHDLVSKAIAILESTDPGILREAYLDPEALEELAFDPRAYDHGHPANRRPNYVFGEWDPHHIDNQGRYRRYVVRQITLDALMDRIDHANELDKEEAVFEAAAVLAGTILMATGTSGSGPNTHDSTTTLASLMPRIARYRDGFYQSLLANMRGPHAERLRAEAAAWKQPFAKVRQHLNQYLAQHRATQLQHRQLALLFAQMGYPDASRKEAARIPAASIRMLSEILCRLATGHLLADDGKLDEAINQVPEAEDLVQRGIACGALADPWNILGYQGLFPLFAAREDSVRDTRIDELVEVVEGIFDLYSRLISEAAASGKSRQGESLLERLRRLAVWWDRFASSGVSDVRRVHGGETVASAEHVARALAHWHERGETAGDIAFWKNHLEGFQSPKAFALVVDALLDKSDFRASLALLMNWVGQAEQISLEDGDYSFHALALRWMLAVTSEKGSGVFSGPPDQKSSGPEKTPDPFSLVVKFFDYLEANADEFWHVPTLKLEPERIEAMPREDEEESLYSAAYEDVTYRDSADDNQEGAVVDEGEHHQPFELEYESERLLGRLHFHSTLARLWHVAAGYQSLGRAASPRIDVQREESFRSWLAIARDHQQSLLSLLDAIHEQPIPAPLGSYESLVEDDRRRQLKEQLLYTAISTCLDTFLAVGILEGSLGKLESPAAEGSLPLDSAQPPGARAPRHADRPPWEQMAIELEQAALAGDAAKARQVLPVFLNLFQDESLLFTPLENGGWPRQILRARIAQSVLRGLVETLPRLGLLRETSYVLKTARAMEQAHPAQVRGITEFNQLFQAGYQGVIEAVVESSAAQDYSPARNQEIVDHLEKLTRPFLALWVEHSQSLQLSALEAVRDESDWSSIGQFVKQYGRELFHAKFMTLGNLRSILHRGVGSYLDYLRENEEPHQPIHLLADLDQKISREQAHRWLALVLQGLVENYEEYKDYNTTTAQSDYGENLYLLLEFLRLKVAYERHAWRLRPLAMAHRVLADANRGDLAASWQDAFERLTSQLADQYETQLNQLEQTHGIRLRTVADRIRERFVKPLALDRLCALVEPAMEQASQEGKKRAFAALQRELKPFVASPTGVGLDVPAWLRRMEEEVRRVHGSQTSLAIEAQKSLSVPRKDLSLQEIREQLEDWEKPFPGN
jgi:hypothetical protein